MLLGATLLHPHTAGQAEAGKGTCSSGLDRWQLLETGFQLQTPCLGTGQAWSRASMAQQPAECHSGLAAPLPPRPGCIPHVSALCPGPFAPRCSKAVGSSWQLAAGLYPAEHWDLLEPISALLCSAGNTAAPCPPLALGAVGAASRELPQPGARKELQHAGVGVQLPEPHCLQGPREPAACRQ